MKGGYIRQAWLVLGLSSCFGVALAGVQIGLKTRIEQNKVDETRDQIPRLVRLRDEAGAVLAEADKAATKEYVAPDGKVAYKAFGADGAHLGWVIKGAGQGFADRIELLIGLDAEAKRITGLYVLDQKETPGLGNKITIEGWQGQFAGLDAARGVTVTKASPKAGHNSIQAVTGATVSSESVCQIVNQAVAEFRQRLGELTEGQ